MPFQLTGISVSEIYIVEQHGGSYEDRYTVNLKAFHDLTKADMFMVECEQKRADDAKTLDLIAEWLEEFKESYPSPVQRWVEYPDQDGKTMAELDAWYEEQSSFLQPIYNEVFRQEWNAWFDIWYSALEGKLQAIGKEPFKADDREDPRTDERNLGMSYDADDHVWFRITTVALG